MTLILKLNLNMVNMYLYTKKFNFYVKGLKVIARTDIHTNRYTLSQRTFDYFPRLPIDIKRNSFFFQSVNGRTYVVIRTLNGKYITYYFLFPAIQKISSVPQNEFTSP